MRFGFSLPSALDGLHYPNDFAGPDDLLRLAARAEALGYHSLSVADFLVATDYVLEHQPGHPSYHEALAMLAALAVRTSRLELMAAVVAVPLRSPLLLARQAATVDALSHGRLTLGLGLGTSREAVLRADRRGPSGQRAAHLEEAIAALRLLWRREAVSFSGAFSAFERAAGHPAAARSAIPIYLGGNAPAMARRAGRLADGWIPFATEEELAALIPVVHAAAAEAGRNPAAIEIAPQYCLAIAPTREQALRLFERSVFRHRFLVGGFKDWVADEAGLLERALVGTPSDLCQRIERLGKLGVKHLVGLIPMARSLAELEEQFELFAREVMPAFA